MRKYFGYHLWYLLYFTRPMPMPMPMARPRSFMNNNPVSRQVCTAVDFSYYSALRHALGPRDVRNLYRARATKDRKTSLVASCTWKQTVVFTYSTGLKKSFYYQVVTVYTQKNSTRAFFTGKKMFFLSFCEIIRQVAEELHRDHPYITSACFWPFLGPPTYMSVNSTVNLQTLPLFWPQPLTSLLT